MFVLSRIGVTMLLVGYTVLGAYLFRELELPQELERRGRVMIETENVRFLN